ncbi:MAG: hypothetical protein E6G09_13330 [Actinobacteria bacterium]|nr:MAG: hypothetical protein E6G09_13330 [Actinomycetota bacterium]
MVDVVLDGVRQDPVVHEAAHRVLQEPLLVAELEVHDGLVYGGFGRCRRHHHGHDAGADAAAEGGPRPPRSSARAVRSKADAFDSGVATGRRLRRIDVDVALGPVLDLPDGPLGSRQFRSPLFGVAFARGLATGGAGACAKHFPGLGSLAFSTDDRPYVRGRVREADLAPYRAAVEAGVPCVMVGHGVYPTLGPRRAALEPAAYRLLRDLGFEGVAITDSLDVVRGHAQEWAVAAARAGADLLLFTSGADAARAIRVLVPLARRGELDVHVARVLRFRSTFD